MASSEISEVAESLFATAHSLMGDWFGFVEKTCKDFNENHPPFDKPIRNEIDSEIMYFLLHLTASPLYSSDFVARRARVQPRRASAVTSEESDLTVRRRSEERARPPQARYRASQQKAW